MAMLAGVSILTPDPGSVRSDPAATITERPRLTAALPALAPSMITPLSARRSDAVGAMVGTYRCAGTLGRDVKRLS